jgi:hypothetical protein
MKHELLYQNQTAFEETEGNSGNVTSVTPGVANIIEGDAVHYNKTYDVLTILYNVTDTSQPTKIFTSNSVKTGLKDVIIGKRRIDASEITNEYQFTKTGINSVKYRYSNLTSVPANAFSGCTSVCNFRLPKSVNSLGGACFDNSGIANVIIPQQITSYGAGIFRNCQSLETAIFNPNISSITIGSVFVDSTNLKRVVLGENIISFGGNSQASAFCTHTPNLREVIFPPTLTRLGGSYPFAENTNVLCEIYFTSTVPPDLGGKIGDMLFRNRRNIKIYVPEESLEDYKTAPIFVSDASKIYPIPSDWDNPYE